MYYYNRWDEDELEEHGTYDAILSADCLFFDTSRNSLGTYYISISLSPG